MAHYFFYIPESIYETKTFRLGSEQHCAYCGKIAQKGIKKGEFDDDVISYYYCNCENAKAEIELQQEIENLKRNYNKKLIEIMDKYESKTTINRELVEEMKYKYEIKLLNQKYRKE